MAIWQAIQIFLIGAFSLISLLAWLVLMAAKSWAQKSDALRYVSGV